MKTILMAVLTTLLGVVLATPAYADGGLSAFTSDKVYVVDLAPSRWPVYTAAEEMDNNSALELVVVSKCPRLDKKNCIFVREASLPTTAAGTTVKWVVNDINIQYSEVKLSSYYGPRYSYHNRLHIVCHEIGHAVGLPHLRGATCMNTYADAHPGSPAYTALRARYGPH